MKISSRNNLGYIGLVIILAVLFIGCSSADKKPVGKSQVPAEIKVDVQQKVVTPQPTDTSKPTTSATIPSDIKEIIQQAVENNLRAKSFKSNVLLEIEMVGMKMSFICDIKKYNELFYVRGEMMGMTVLESYSDGKNIATKDQMSQIWRCGTADQQQLISLFEQMQRKIYLEHLQDARLLGEEKNCQIIEATINPAVLKNFIEKQELPMMETEGVSFDKISLKIWIGKEDRLLYKTICLIESTMDREMLGLPSPEENEENDEEEKDIEDEEEDTNPDDSQTPKAPSRVEQGKMKAIFTIEVTFSDYNKVAPIVIPPEVKKMWETPIEKDLKEGSEKEMPERVTPPSKPTKK